MNDYANFPPLSQFKRVLRSAPQSAEIFVFLWMLKAKEKIISIQRKEVMKTFHISPTILRKHLFAIGRLDLILFQETPDFFLIDFSEYAA